MKKIFVLMASAAVLFAACNKMEEVNTPVDTPVGTEVITVVLNPVTKTSLDGKATVWTAGDEVSVTVGSKNIGTLALVEGSTFSGQLESAALDGATEVTLHYPAGVTAVPATQEAVADSFANEAALLDGTATMAALRAGEGASLQNKTALLQFTVAQAGDVTFEVGTAKYTVTGCKTGETYYACVAPASNVAFTARIGGYLSKQASKNVTFTANKIANLEKLPAPVASDYSLIGSHTNNWSFSALTPLYKDVDGTFAAYNLNNLSEFKIVNKSATGWDSSVTTNKGVGTTIDASGITVMSLSDNSSNIKVVGGSSVKYNIIVSASLSEITIEETGLSGEATKYSIAGSNGNWDSDIVFLTTSVNNVVVAKNITLRFAENDGGGVKIRQDKAWTTTWSCNWKALKVNTKMDCRKGYDCNMLFADNSSDWNKNYDVYVQLASGSPSKFIIVTSGSAAPTF